MDSLIIFSIDCFANDFQIDLTPLGHGHDANVFRVMHK